MKGCGREASKSPYGPQMPHRQPKKNRHLIKSLENHAESEEQLLLDVNQELDEMGSDQNFNCEVQAICQNYEKESRNVRLKKPQSTQTHEKPTTRGLNSQDSHRTATRLSQGVSRDDISNIIAATNRFQPTSMLLTKIYTESKVEPHISSEIKSISNHEISQVSKPAPAVEAKK